jgi:hypothetical protein
MAIVVLTMAAFFAAFAIIGPDSALRPGEYAPSNLWIAISFLLGFLAAVAGGFVCAAIARDAGGPNLLAAAILALGLIFAVFVLMERVEGETVVRPPDVEVAEAMTQAQQPAWVAFVNPFVGIAGVLLGSRLKRR